MQLPKKEKKCSQFFSLFYKSGLHFEDFERKMTLIAGVFKKLQIAK